MQVAWVSAGLAYTVFLVASARLIIVDLTRLRLPNRTVLGVLACLIVFLSLAAVMSGDLSRIVVGAACGAGYFFVFLVLAAWKPGALGGGDVKVAPAIGVSTGWLHIDAALIVTPIAIAIITMATLLWQRSAQRSRAGVYAFGPTLIVAGWVGVLAGALMVAEP